MEYVTLNNGVRMPILGYGVYQVTKEECERCVLDALKVGYRAIDTAQSYFNERGVGEGIRTCGIPREDLFVVSKVAAEHKTYESAAKSIDETLSKMGLDYLDMMILDFNKMVEELGSVETLKTDFISNVSHEMKTPIAIIKNYAELLQKKNVTEQERQEYAGDIEEAAVRLSNLISNILL